MSDVTTTIKSMLDKGQDPKEYLLEVCRPECKAKADKLHRCEVALKNMTDADPELSCMYPLRDWVTCIDSCVHLSSFRSNQKSTPSSPATRRDGSHDPIYEMINKNLKKVINERVHYHLSCCSKDNLLFFPPIFP